MVKWEYKIVHTGELDFEGSVPVIKMKSGPDIDPNVLGQDGWEMVAWHPSTYGPIMVFKRPLNER